MDLNLEQLLRAGNPEQRKIMLENLFSSQIEPIVKKTIRIKFSSVPGPKQDQEDISSQALLKLWNQLQKWLEDPSQVNVSNFSGYVAATTLNCCKEYFRSKRPRRWHLRNRLRYLLTNNLEFAIWKSKTDDWVAGFSNWKDREQIKIEAPTRFTLNSELLNKVGPGQVKLREVIRLIFRTS